jgi:hypothetical protein
MGAIIGRHVVEKSSDIILGHRLEQQFLRGEVEVFEDVGGKLARQNTKDDHLILNRQTDNQARQVRGLPVLELPAQCGEVARAHDSFEIRALNRRSWDILIKMNNAAPALTRRAVNKRAQ